MNKQIEKLVELRDAVQKKITQQERKIVPGINKEDHFHLFGSLEAYTGIIKDLDAILDMQPESTKVTKLRESITKLSSDGTLDVDSAVHAIQEALGDKPDTRYIPVSSCDKCPLSYAFIVHPDGNYGCKHPELYLAEYNKDFDDYYFDEKDHPYCPLDKLP